MARPALTLKAIRELNDEQLRAKYNNSYRAWCNGHEGKANFTKLEKVMIERNLSLVLNIPTYF